MRSSHKLVRVETTFDEDSLVANARLQVPAALAQKLGVAEFVDERVKLPKGEAGRANSGSKAVIGAMLAGADSIDDTDILRAGRHPSGSIRSGPRRRSGPGCGRSTGLRCGCWMRSHVACWPARGRPGWDPSWMPI